MVKVRITWKAIILGLDKKYAENNCISMICYIIYKKYLMEKDEINHQAVRPFLKKELRYKLEIFQGLISYDAICTCLGNVIDAL